MPCKTKVCDHMHTSSTVHVPRQHPTNHPQRSRAQPTSFLRDIRPNQDAVRETCPSQPNSGRTAPPKQENSRTMECTTTSMHMQTAQTLSKSRFHLQGAHSFVKNACGVLFKHLASHEGLNFVFKLNYRSSVETHQSNWGSVFSQIPHL